MGRARPLCPGISDINLFRYRKGVIDFNAETRPSNGYGQGRDVRLKELAGSFTGGLFSDESGFRGRLGGKSGAAIDPERKPLHHYSFHDARDGTSRYDPT